MQLTICDFDGSVSPAVPDPKDADFNPGFLDYLYEYLKDPEKLFMFLTGRDARFLYEKLPDDLKSKTPVRGNHGLSTVDKSGHFVISPQAAHFAAATDELVEKLALSFPSISPHIENKTLGIVVHLRWVQDLVAERMVKDIASFFESNPELAVHFEPAPSDGILELKPRIFHDKGTAVKEIVDEIGHDEITSLSYVGNDLPDIPAFIQSEVLRREHGWGGRNLIVYEDGSAITHQDRAFIYPGDSEFASIEDLIKGMNADLSLSRPAARARDQI